MHGGGGDTKQINKYKFLKNKNCVVQSPHTCEINNRTSSLDDLTYVILCRSSSSSPRLFSEGFSRVLKHLSLLVEVAGGLAVHSEL